MEYLEFIEELKRKLAESRNIGMDDITVYMKGYAGMDDKERAFIRKNNHEVCQNGSDVVTDDYICIRLGGPDYKYCFMLLGLLYDLFNEQGWEGVFDLVDRDAWYRGMGLQVPAPGR